jgi:hypothetical protein
VIPEDGGCSSRGVPPRGYMYNNICIYNMFPKVGQLEETKGEEKKKRMIESE